MKVVVKIGGHIFTLQDSNIIMQYSKIFKKLRKNGHQIIIVTGGGNLARRYIKLARKLDASESDCDTIGIEISKINARLLIAGLGEDAYPEPPKTIDELRKAFQVDKIVVMGGLQPGQSTNAVGILASEAVRAELFINATNVNGVHARDPKKDPKAKKLDVITTQELLTLTSHERLEAGGYTLFDPVAIRIVERSGITTRIVDGRKPTNIERAIRGEAVGTLIKPTRVVRI